MECRFCGRRRCRQHDALELPWEGLPGKRGPKPRPLRPGPERGPVAVRDENGEIAMVGVVCPGCRVVAASVDNRCPNCLAMLPSAFDDVLVSELRFLGET